MDQIGSNRHANMFAHKIRDRDAPGYSSVVLHPVDLKSVRAAITHGNKAAIAAAALLPDADAGASTALLPIGEDFVPPRAIINSAQLDCELVHMFANAIMYNPDSHRGFGPSFAPQASDLAGSGGDADASALGYKVDEDGVVKEARAMYYEVEKLLNEMRSAEIQRGPKLAADTGASTRQASVAGGGGDSEAPEEEELAPAPVEEPAAEGHGTAKRRRVARG
jgi:hypothetical protein